MNFNEQNEKNWFKLTKSYNSEVLQFFWVNKKELKIEQCLL